MDSNDFGLGDIVQEGLFSGCPIRKICNNKHNSFEEIKNKDGEIIREKSGISKVVEDFYIQLYSTTILQPENAAPENITNVESADIPDFTTDEQMKNGRIPGPDGIFAEMLKLAGSATL
ncbi:hypothetical protein ILUMI_00398 [Ignelater luminosus]|uniref:Uncharacterized protein n=1 Tax=Ignelater luminosus TaxID=2038154 RepID=A0A8K0GN55_IGNLU|nr:hypothetical protein ILUMI_00398 [Ignelater luminosus]